MKLICIINKQRYNGETRGSLRLPRVKKTFNISNTIATNLKGRVTSYSIVGALLHTTNKRHTLIICT